MGVPQTLSSISNDGILPQKIHPLLGYPHDELETPKNDGLLENPEPVDMMERLRDGIGHQSRDKSAYHRDTRMIDREKRLQKW